jgi:broad specificity phosphatase PhoE
MITEQKITLPQTYYTSPLTRCLQTANLTFSGLPLPEESPFIPIIKELLREEIGVHTCDRRSKKSEIQKMFPRWRFEEGFKEEDPLWGPSERETAEGQDRRTRIVLDDVFEADGNTWVSVSSHSGEIASILRGMIMLSLLSNL